MVEPWRGEHLSCGTSVLVASYGSAGGLRRTFRESPLGVCCTKRRDFPQACALYLMTYPLQKWALKESCEATCMRFIHHFRPLLELGSCKEYGMAQKTNGNGTRRTRKPVSAQPPTVLEPRKDTV